MADQATVDVVGDLAADLDAAVHRAGMHDQRVGFGHAQLVVVETEEVKIFPARRHERAVHALALQPQHHDDVDIGEPGAHLVEHLDPEPLDLGRQQGARRYDAHPGTHRVQERNVRARHPAVQDVAADRDREPAEPALAAANRQRVEQRLGWVLVAAVAGVDDGAIYFFRQQLHRPQFGMAHDQHVGMHRVQRHRGVDQGLALDHRADRDGHVDDVGAEPFAGDLERGAGAGRIFEKAVDDRAPAQQRAFFFGLTIEFDIAVGEVEKLHDLRRRQSLDSEEVAVPERGVAIGALHRLPSIVTLRAAARLHAT